MLRAGFHKSPQNKADIKSKNELKILRRGKKSCVGGSVQSGRFERRALTMFTAHTIAGCKFSGRGFFGSSDIHNHIFLRAEDLMFKFLIHVKI